MITAINKLPKYYIVILFFTFSFFQLSIAQLSLIQLRTENKIDPIGVDTKEPRFSWVLNSEMRETKQSAYELLVKTGKKIVWESGKINDETSIFNGYKGIPLLSNAMYTWQVRAWDNHGNVSPWVTATFATAFLNPSDWKAKWITSGMAADTVNGVVPVLRKAFTAKKQVKSAKAYITARGLYEAEINGKRVGNQYLSPGWTSYNKHLQYQVFDVTSAIIKGQNAISVLLGSGWYRTRLAWVNQQNIYGDTTALLFQLEIEYTNGSKETIISDKTWKTSTSHIVSSEIYDGETQDMNKFEDKWSINSFSDAYWNNAVEMNFPTNYINASINEPMTKHEAIKPIRVFKTAKGENVIDFGQNLVGWVQIKLKGSKGSKIKLYHAEMLDKHGSPYFENLRSAKAQAEYTLSGNGEETLEPHFTFFGFQYVKVEGLQQINPDDFTAYAIYSDMPAAGTFICSNPLLNQLQKNIQWGQKGNFLDVPTDCPQRDERLGWTGDAEVFSRTASFNFNTNLFFAKWLKDVSVDQNSNGSVPFVIPDVLRGTGFGQPVGAAGWSDASIIIPYNMYVVYGDKKLLMDQYATMQKYLNYVQDASGSDDLWNTGFQFADWLSYRVDDSQGMIGMKSAITDNYLVAQCFYGYNVEIMIKTAKILGKMEDVAKYEDLLKRVKTAFQKEFMTANGRLISNTQTAYILALQFDMLPEGLRMQAADRLDENIASYEYHLTTGFLGTPFLNPVLSRFGKSETAFKLLLQETYPSWLYPIKTHGATTIWERWDSMKPDSTFQSPSMTSFNHYSYGAIGDWMYRNVAGIDTKEGQGSGYKLISYHPEIGGNLTHVKATFQSNYGLISSEWKIEGSKFSYDIEIPCNTTGEVSLPKEVKGPIMHEGKSIEVKDRTPMVLGSGKYHFEAALQR